MCGNIEKNLVLKIKGKILALNSLTDKKIT